MNYITIVRPINEILPLVGTPYSTTAPFYFIPFSPVSYLGIGV